MGLVQTPRQKTVCSRGEARPALSRTRSPSSGPLQSRHPGVTAERARARRGRATFRLCDNGTRRLRDAGERGRNPRAPLRGAHPGRRRVTAVTTRGWRAAGQVSTGRSMWLRVPAARLCPHLQQVRRRGLGGIPRSRPLAVSRTLLCAAARSGAERAGAGRPSAERTGLRGRGVAISGEPCARSAPNHPPPYPAGAQQPHRLQPGGARLHPFTK